MKSIPAISIATILLSIAGLSLSGCMKCSSTKEESCPPSPELRKRISLSEIGPEGLAKAVERHRGRVVLVDYWATWCVPCRELFPHTVDLHNRFSPDDLAVITVSMNKRDQRDSVLEFLRRQRADTENYLGNIDSDTEAFEAFDMPGSGIPYLRIYDRSGKIFRVFTANLPAEIEQAVVEAIGKGKTSD